jgi:hypothetical protein
VHASGVLSGPSGFLSTLLGLASGRVRESQGYVVTVREAMAVLAAAAPEAEAWWRQHVPRMFEGERSFVFAASCGELVGGAAPAAPAQRAGRLDAASSTAKMLLWLAALVAIDVGIPLGWRSGWLRTTSPRLWVMLVLSAGLTVVVGLLLVARLRATKQRAIDAQR